MSGEGDLNSRPMDSCARHFTVHCSTPELPPVSGVRRGITPALGIEPRTCRLTADRSANGALKAGELLTGIPCDVARTCFRLYWDVSVRCARGGPLV